MHSLNRNGFSTQTTEPWPLSSDASSLYSFDLISVKNSFAIYQDENEQEIASG